jgi:hypothetical protein
MHKTILCIAYIKINTIHLHHQSNFNQKSSIMKIKLILVCPIRDLGFDASTNVSQNITSRKPGSITGKVIDKTVTKPFHMSMSL